MLKKPILQQNDFVGGLVTKGPELSLQLNQTPDCLNVYSDIFKKLMRRNGYNKLNSISASATGGGIYNYVRTEGEQYMISLFDGALKKMDIVNNTWDGILDPVSANANGTALSDSIMHNVSFNGDCIIFTESRDVPQKYDPNDNSGQYTDLHYGGSGTAPSTKIPFVWHNRVWALNTSSNPDRFYRSADSDHTSWDSLDYDEIVTSGDVGLTGVGSLRGRMYIFKKWSIHRITYLGGSPLLDIRPTKSSIGTLSHRSIVNIEIPGKGEVLLFLGSDLQIYIFDGYNATPISENISTSNSISNYCLIGDGSTYGLNYNQLSKVHSVNYSRKHWCIMFFCLGDDTTPQDAFVYNYYTGAFWPFHFGHSFVDSCISDNGTGQNKTYIIGDNYIWLFDDGNDDDGIAIEGYWVSSKLDIGVEVQYVKIYEHILNTASNASTPLFYYRYNYETNWSSATVLAASTNEHPINISITEKIYQWKIYDNSSSAAFELIRSAIIVEQKGIGVT